MLVERDLYGTSHVRKMFVFRFRAEGDCERLTFPPAEKILVQHRHEVVARLQLVRFKSDLDVVEHGTPREEEPVKRR